MWCILQKWKPRTCIEKPVKDKTTSVLYIPTCGMYRMWVLWMSLNVMFHAELLPSSVEDVSQHINILTQQPLSAHIPVCSRSYCLLYVQQSTRGYFQKCRQDAGSRNITFTRLSVQLRQQQTGDQAPWGMKWKAASFKPGRGGTPGLHLNC